MDSEDEEEATKSEEKPVKEPPQPQKASGIALPITEMTDDWMDDREAIGSMDSEDEEDDLQPPPVPAKEDELLPPPVTEILLPPPEQECTGFPGVCNEQPVEEPP